MEWIRITKAKARKLYEKGKSVWCLPSKMNPYSVWIQPYLMPNEASYLGEPPKKEWVRTWEQADNAFRYYNCDEERGKFVKYYVQN